VKAQKNDELDAEAIAEAATRPTMRFVAMKSQAQSDIQALHRARERLVAERTALINHLRALLLERGIVAPQGRRKLEEELSVFADEDQIEVLSPRIRLLIEDLRREWRALDDLLEEVDRTVPQVSGAVAFFEDEWPKLEDRTKSSILATLRAWYTTITGHPDTLRWAMTRAGKSGVDLTGVLKGKRIGILAPAHRYGEAGRW
jgi:transposase